MCILLKQISEGPPCCLGPWVRGTLYPPSPTPLILCGNLVKSSTTHYTAGPIFLKIFLLYFCIDMAAPCKSYSRRLALALSPPRPFPIQEAAVIMFRLIEKACDSFHSDRLRLELAQSAFLTCNYIFITLLKLGVKARGRFLRLRLQFCSALYSLYTLIECMYLAHVQRDTE